MTDEEKTQKIKQAYDENVAISTGDAKPTYAGTYDQQIADLYDQIANREDFSYDLNGDALYQQYKDNYMQQGKQAMKDTMGQTAALTGGYGSSYAQKAGQQAYDASLQNLTDIIPELWNMAYQVYQDKGTQLQNQYSMLGDLRDTEYNRYQNDLSNWNYDQEQAYGKWTDAYNRTINEEQTAYNREQDAYNKQQTAYSNLYALIGNTGYSPSDAELASAGMSRAQANALIAEYQRQIAASSSSSSSGGGSGSGSKTSTKTTTSNQNLYSSGELLAAAAGTKDTAGATYSEIMSALKKRGVDTSSKYVQADVKWALSK